jgi:hypothetical protein
VRAARVELDAEHLTFDELLAPPPEIAAIVKRRRAEHRRVQKLALPDVVSVVGPQAALNLETKETRAWTPSLTT